MRKTNVFLPMILAALALANPVAALEPTTISFMIWGDPVEKQAYDQLVSSFHAGHPDILVDLIHVPNQNLYIQRLTTDFVAGTPADVFLLNYRRMAPFAAKGRIEPLDSRLKKSALIHEDDFYREAMEPFRWDGKQMAIPQNISSLVVYYNRSLFAAAGIPYPKPDWTWDEFIATAKALTKDTDGDGTIDQYGLGTEAVVFRVFPFIWQNGGDFFDDPEKPTRLTLDTPETRGALEWFIGFQSVHKIVPDFVAEKAEPSVHRFMRGAMAMYFDSRRGVPVYRNVQGFDWDVAPLPTGKQPAGILHSDGYFMSKQSKHKDAAWTFIEYANSEEGQKLMCGTGRTVPSMRRVAESQVFLETDHKPASSQVFLDVIPHIRAVPRMETWPDIETRLGEEFERAYHLQTTLDEAIRLSKERTADLFPKK
ncbi:MAG TPA: sugar ABC transporter substrate-binding protein [Candidatus Eisenbacteria bacterium]